MNRLVLIAVLCASCGAWAADGPDIHKGNGAIVIGPDARVAGTVQSVNGAIELGHTADVSGHLINVNGRISLESAHVADGIETVSGDIDVGHDSRVEGGILVRQNHGAGAFDAVVLRWFGLQADEPTIVIGPNAVVQGPLRFERDVKLYVSAQAHIGPVEGARAIPYSGAHPPTVSSR